MDKQAKNNLYDYEMAEPASEEIAADFEDGKAARRVVSYTIGKTASAVISFITLIILARILGAGSYGLYTIAIAFAGMAGIFGHIGIGTALRKKLAENGTDKSELVSTAFFITILLGLAVAAIAMAFSSFIATEIYSNSKLIIPLIIASSSIFFSVLMSISLSTLTGLKSAGKAGLLNIVYTGSQLAFILLMLWLGYGITGAVFALLLGNAIAAFIGILIIKKKGIQIRRPSRQIAKKIVEFSLPVFISNIANSGLLNFAILFLGFFETAAVIGNYGVAYKLGIFFNVIISASSFAVLSEYSDKISNEKNAKSIYIKSIYYSLLLLLPIFAYIASIVKPVVPLFFSKGYSNVPEYFFIVALGFILSIFGSYASNILLGKGKTKDYMKYQIAIILLSFALLVILTPVFKVYGMLFSIFIAMPILSWLMFSLVIKKEGFEIKDWKTARLILTNFAFLAIMMLLSMLMHFDKLSIIVNAILAIIIYFPMLAITKSADAKDLEYVKKSINIKAFGKLIDFAIMYMRIFE
ncbi:MAG: flippase [Candidatus Micrarchaeia archaeon]